MKYNEEVYLTGKELSENVRVKPKKETEETKKLGKKVLKALIQKAKAESNLNKNGIVKVSFLSRFFGKQDIGYSEINTLLLLGKFEEFAREYCIYLGEVRREADECGPAYFELTWDYKTYFDGIELQKSIESAQTSNNIQRQMKKKEEA